MILVGAEQEELSPTCQLMRCSFVQLDAVLGKDAGTQAAHLAKYWTFSQSSRTCRATRTEVLSSWMCHRVRCSTVTRTCAPEAGT